MTVTEIIILSILGVNTIVLFISIWLNKSKGLDTKFITLEQSLKTEFQQNKQEIINDSRENRKELNAMLKGVGDSLFKQFSEISENQKNQIHQLTESNEKKLNAMRETIEKKLTQMQSDNSAKLEKMRETVDEKLQSTLEKRLGESFNLVSQRLEEVQKGLGEMQNLATGVGDLKKVLTNVKTRGTWGEVQLSFLMEDMLSPEQYEKNVHVTSRTKEVVEYAVKLPNQSGEKNEHIWLPIDAKFPQSDYEKLIEAQEDGNPELTEKYRKQLVITIKKEARDIRDKYIKPPHTTDFAIMFVPIESLYAEILRTAGLASEIQSEYKIVIASPTTLSALLNSLQIGFKSLAIEKRTSEIWKLLGAVKTQFGKFGDMLDKTKRKLEEASNTIDDASSRSRQIEKKLKKVEELPQKDAVLMLEE